MLRREFLRSVLAGGALAAVPAILVPERKIWQVHRNTPLARDYYQGEVLFDVTGKAYCPPEEEDRLAEWAERWTPEEIAQARKQTIFPDDYARLTRKEQVAEAVRVVEESLKESLQGFITDRPKGVVSVRGKPLDQATLDLMNAYMMEVRVLATGQHRPQDNGVYVSKAGAWTRVKFDGHQEEKEA